MDDHLNRSDAADRSDALEQYVLALRDICTRTRDKEALAVADYFTQHAVLASPLPYGFVPYSERWPDKPVFFLPLLDSDRNIGGEWEPFFSETHGTMAEFDPDRSLICLRTFIPCNRLVKGLLLFHEGKHARTYGLHPYDHTDNNMHTLKEVDTYNHQNRILFLLGGSKYRKALRKEVSWMRIDLGAKVGTHMGKKREDYPFLDEVFGPPESELERKYRQSFFWLHANFALLEERFGSGAESRKLLVMAAYERLTRGSSPKAA